LSLNIERELGPDCANENDCRDARGSVAFEAFMRNISGAGGVTVMEMTHSMIVFSRG